MKLHVENNSDTEFKLSVEASVEELTKVKNKTLQKFSGQVKVAGFRPGKAPLPVVEKSIPSETLQTEFLSEAVNMLYLAAIKDERIRPVSQPQIAIKKFVPFTQLEIDLTVTAISRISLPNYRKYTSKRNLREVTANDVDSVLENLRTRAAEKKPVKRAAKNGDEAWIDFDGTDLKGKSIDGASGKDYPLLLGSKSFIPGFEDEIVGMKAGEQKTFKITFPKDYGQKTLQSKQVEFSITLNKLNEAVKPKLDNEFAGKVGPFKSLAELKKDIEKQLEKEAEEQAERDFEAALIGELTSKMKVVVPDEVLADQDQAVFDELKRTAISRGTTYDEFLKGTGKSEEEFRRTEVRPESERRVYASLLLSEIADVEGINVLPEELEARLQALKAQYKDPKTHEELDKPENRRELSARLRSEKVIQFLKG